MLLTFTPCEDLFCHFGVFLALKKHTEILCIPYYCSVAIQFTPSLVLNLKSVFHAMKRDVSE